MTDEKELNLNIGSIDEVELTSELDALFTNTRQDEPVLFDDNFTKIVANSLPSGPITRRNPGLSFELIGGIVGLIFTYFLFDLNSVVVGLLNVIPETVTLSPMHALLALGMVSAMSLFAWWAVENNRS